MKIEFENEKLNAEDLRDLLNTLTGCKLEDGLTLQIGAVIEDDVAVIGKGDFGDMRKMNLVSIADIILKTKENISTEEIADEVESVTESLCSCISFLKNHPKEEVE